MRLYYIPPLYFLLDALIPNGDSNELSAGESVRRQDDARYLMELIDDLITLRIRQAIAPHPEGCRADRELTEELMSTKNRIVEALAHD